jgi:hypothetical protein
MPPKKYFFIGNFTFSMMPAPSEHQGAIYSKGLQCVKTYGKTFY